MGVISVSLPSDGQTIDAADYNTPITTIVNLVNGNIDNANIASAAGISTSKLATDAGITSGMLANGAVTASKLATGVGIVTVSTSETTTSTSYTDLSTPGPATTVTIGANGYALVILTCTMNNSSANTATYMGFAVSGASTVAAADANAMRYNIPTGGGAQRFSVVIPLTGLTPGSTTFTSKYRVPSGTGTFVDRTITVLPL